jgi:hypothetical protein
VNAVKHRMRIFEGWNVELGCVALAVALAVGCGDGSDEEVDPGTDATDEGITVTGVVKEFEPNLERQQFKFLSGVEVCIYDDEDIDCDTTSAGGAFELRGVPADTNVLLSFKKKDYAQTLRMLATRQQDYDLLAETALARLQLGIDEAAKNGIDLTTFKGGAIQFFAAEPGDGVLQVALLSDFTATLETLDGKPAQCNSTDGGLEDCRALYLDEDGETDPKLTKASATGVGAFGNVPPGQYKITVKHPTRVCPDTLPESGWGIDDNDAVLVQAVDKWVTAQVGVFCQPPE